MQNALLRLALLFPLLLAACGTTSSLTPESGELRTHETLDLAPEVKITAESGAAAAVLAGIAPQIPIYGDVFTFPEAALLLLIYDPLAPNWRVEEQRLSDDSFRLFLRAKNFRRGGDGESTQIIRRRAQALMRQLGYASYQLLDYSESIASSTPLAYRVAEATIVLVKAPSAPTPQSPAP